jgi:hypothetical protein
MESRISLMKALLNGLKEEIKEVGEQIKTTGMVPKEICKLCNVIDKRKIGKFSSREKESNFLEWLKAMNVIAIEKRKFDNTIYFKTSEKLKNTRAEYEDEESHVYSRYRGSFYKKARDLIKNYEIINTCQHISRNPKNILKIGQRTSAQSESEYLGIPTSLVKEKSNIISTYVVMNARISYKILCVTE